jgi:hypothetical protein
VTHIEALQDGAAATMSLRLGVSDRSAATIWPVS